MAAKEKLKGKLKALMEYDTPQPRWTAGNPIFSCHGCGTAFSVSAGERKGGTGGTKGVCTFCDLNKRAELQHQANLAKGRISKEKRDLAFKASPTKQAAYKNKQVFEDTVTRKLGFYRLANVQYTKG